VRLDVRLREREAQAGAPERARRRRIDLEERLEDLRDLIARDADPGIADHELDRRAGTALAGLVRGQGAPPQRDPDLAAIGRELHRVRHQARDDLPDLAAIADDDRIGARVELDRDAAAPRLRRKRGELAGDQIGQ